MNQKYIITVKPVKLVILVNHSWSSSIMTLGHSFTLSAIKAAPLQAWSDLEDSRKLRFPDFMTKAQDGGKVVSLSHRPPLPPGNAPGTNFYWVLCFWIISTSLSWPIEGLYSFCVMPYISRNSHALAELHVVHSTSFLYPQVWIIIGRNFLAATDPLLYCKSLIHRQGYVPAFLLDHLSALWTVQWREW